MASFDIVLIIQIAIAAIVVPLLVSFLLYYFWPDVWHFIADKVTYVWSILIFPCVSLSKCCCNFKSTKKQYTHEPHYIGPERTTSEDPLRQSRTKAERKLRVENPKRREMTAAEELSSAEQQRLQSRKAQATRVEKLHKQPSEMTLAANKKASMQSGFKYPFQEEGVSEEVNPYLSGGSGSSPPRCEQGLLGLSEQEEGQEQGDLETGSAGRDDGRDEQRA